ncbi:integral membrane protein [Colletotrichum tofieldiae]|uniref:Integral membrane protein n=1 Tax=Colletotrichum tofieldiae TaxID=708197 RepID=A0A166LPA9_9PEZI|nr:integral membrane protein [Colletotrichum tofieldiae]
MFSRMGAAPAPEGVVPNLQYPQDALHTINLVSQIFSVTLVSVFMFLRLYAKAFVTPPMYIEDFFDTENSPRIRDGCSCVVHRFGGGFHAYEISKEDFENLRLTSILGLYADALVYGPTSFFVKLSLLLVVIRLFEQYRKTSLWTYAVIVFMVGYYLPVAIVKALMCRPVAGFWDATVEAVCFNQHAIFVADTAVSALTDMAVLSLPIPVTLTLKMSWTKRLRVIAMLSTGGLATAASIIRMILVVQLQKSDDESVSFIRFNLLGTVEVSIGIICGCLPSVNILFQRFFYISQNSSPETGDRSMEHIELNFFAGSKLQTQHFTTTESEPIFVPQETNPQEDYFLFPIERLIRSPQPLQRNEDRRIWSDKWYSKVTAAPFSELGSPGFYWDGGRSKICRRSQYGQWVQQLHTTE